jgi:hypothetical protein
MGRIHFITALLLVGPSLAQADAPDRVVAIGDLHGDLDNAINALQLTGAVDAAGHWIGGKTTLVQTGDTTDRGPDSRAILDLMATLGDEASQAGGTVVALLGNHEVMNLQGDLRYVDPGDFAAFGGPEARAAAFGPAGQYGQWLLQRDISAKVGDTVYCHGGITQTWAEKGIAGINAEARQAIVAGAGPVLGSEGPLWYRGYVQEPEASACPKLQQALDTLGAKRMVVGHTTRRDGKVEARCGGALLVIDIGIADHYGGHLGAIEIVDGDAKALYPTGSVDLVDP